MMQMVEEVEVLWPTAMSNMQLKWEQDFRRIIFFVFRDVPGFVFVSVFRNNLINGHISFLPFLKKH